MRATTVTKVAAAALIAVLGQAAPAFAETIAFEVQLSGANQVPPINIAATGTLVATFDTESNTLSWTATFQGLTGPATAAHFHGPALQGANAGVLVLIEGSLTSPITGEAVLAPEVANALMAGELYLNIHTAAFPAGELRGQLLPPEAE